MSLLTESFILPKHTPSYENEKKMREKYFNGDYCLDHLATTAGWIPSLFQCEQSNLIFSRSQEFIRVGYYVSNEYQDAEMQETPPEQPLFDKLTRNILVSFGLLYSGG